MMQLDGVPGLMLEDTIVKLCSYFASYCSSRLNAGSFRLLLCCWNSSIKNWLFFLSKKCNQLFLCIHLHSHCFKKFLQLSCVIKFAHWLTHFLLNKAFIWSVHQNLQTNWFCHCLLCVSENGAFDGELPRQPESCGTGQPTGPAPGFDSSHMWQVWFWCCTCPSPERRHQSPRVTAGQIFDWARHQGALCSWPDSR